MLFQFQMLLQSTNHSVLRNINLPIIVRFLIEKNFKKGTFSGTIASDQSYFFFWTNGQAHI